MSRLSFQLLKWQRQNKLISLSLYLELFHVFYDEFMDRNVYLQVLHELTKSRNWAGLYVADNSCFHYRRVSLLKQRNSIVCPFSYVKDFFHKNITPIVIEIEVLIMIIWLWIVESFNHNRLPIQIMILH